MMTDEEIAGIRARAEAAYRWVWRDRTQDGPRSDAVEQLAQSYSQDMPALLAEVGQLRERVVALEAVRDAASANVQRLMERDAALREIVEAVVKGLNIAQEIDAGEFSVLAPCPFCHHGTQASWLMELAHTPDCPVTAARALLATPEGEE